MIQFFCAVYLVVTPLQLNQLFFTTNKTAIPRVASIPEAPLYELNQQSESQGSQTDPKLIWLMSFPNSGTSFTIHLVRQVGKISTASNYGMEYQDTNGNSLPVFANSNQTGPFWTDSGLDPDFVRPTSGYIMVKTHCGGRCTMCPPHRWVETPESFLYRCLLGEQELVNEMGQKITKRVKAPYDGNLVDKAIHLFRDPFDNIVSRFHLEVNEATKRRDPTYQKDRAGFRSFCHDMETQFGEIERDSNLLDQDILKRISKVPCHTDFLRYVQWHNWAFHVTMYERKVPIYVLHYENYETRYEKTVNELFDFLEIEKKGDAIEFIGGKTYHNYFTLEERQSIKWMMRKLATNVTWQNIHHYFAE